MTLEQIEVLEASLHHLRRDSVLAAEVFYGRLFSRRPQLRRMFGGSPDADGRRLLLALNAVTVTLADPQQLVGLFTLFARPPGQDALDHVECIDAFRDATQWMLLKHGPGHPRPVRAAWHAAYRKLSDAAKRQTVKRIAAAKPAARRARPPGSRAASVPRSVPRPPLPSGPQGG
jgi:hemoglobin-like flavoprotein